MGDLKGVAGVTLDRGGGGRSRRARTSTPQQRGTIAIITTTTINTVTTKSTTNAPYQQPQPTNTQGDKRLFIRGDELEAAWALYTPVLHALEGKKVRRW